MPRDISTNLIIEKNKLHAKYPWLLLLEFHVNDIADTVKRFVRNYEDLRFLSEKYYDSGCVAHWKLDDNEEDKVVIDSSGNGNTGTLMGGDNTENKSVAGKVDNAFDFNGSDDYVDCNSSFQPTFRGSFSISLWCKPDDGRPATNERFFGAYDGDSYVHLMYAYTGLLYFYYLSEGNMGNHARTVNEVFPDGATEWTHIVVTADSTIGGIGGKKIYVNGVEAELHATYNGNTTGVDFSEFTSAQNLFLGALNADGSDIYHFAGAIDNVQLFDRALTADDIALLYNLGNGTAKVPALFTGFPFKLETITQKGGEVPTTTLRISNVTQFLQSYLENNDGCTESSVVIMLVHADNLDEDYAELILNFDVIFPHITAKHVDFKVGCPSPLRQRFPLRRYYGDSCGVEFESARCGYTRKTVDDVTLSGTDPISIELTGHGFADEDSIRLADINGITPSLTAIFTVTRTDANNFTLDDTDSSDYSGAYTSGGTAGYAFCDRIREDCRDRENETRFGGCPGLRGETIRFA